MIDFEKQTDDIKNYFENNLNRFIDRINSSHNDLVVPYPSKYEVDFPDNFSNSEKIVFYILPWDYDITELTNETDNLLSRIKVIVTFRGYSDADLYKIAQRYMKGIYTLICEENTLGNIVNYTSVKGIHYEKGLIPGMKSIEFNLELSTESTRIEIILD